MVILVVLGKIWGEFCKDWGDFKRKQDCYKRFVGLMKVNDEQYGLRALSNTIPISYLN